MTFDDIYDMWVPNFEDIQEPTRPEIRGSHSSLAQDAQCNPMHTTCFQWLTYPCHTCHHFCQSIWSQQPPAATHRNLGKASWKDCRGRILPSLLSPLMQAAYTNFDFRGWYAARADRRLLGTICLINSFKNHDWMCVLPGLRSCQRFAGFSRKCSSIKSSNSSWSIEELRTIQLLRSCHTWLNFQKSENIKVDQTKEKYMYYMSIRQCHSHMISKLGILKKMMDNCLP